MKMEDMKMNGLEKEKIKDKSIIVDDHSSLLDKTGMFHKQFVSDFRQVRYFGLLIVQKAPPLLREVNLLEQQVTELLKNAIKHGNKLNLQKRVNVWYLFDELKAHLIVEDEGEGFQNVREWNAFNQERCECLRNEDFEKLVQFVSFRSLSSDMQDGGNALFAALEYWNGGVVLNEKKNTIGVLKMFPKRFLGGYSSSLDA